MVALLAQRLMEHLHLSSGTMLLLDSKQHCWEMHAGIPGVYRDTNVRIRPPSVRIRPPRCTAMLSFPPKPIRAL